MSIPFRREITSQNGNTTTKAEVNLAEKSVTLEGTAAEAAWKKAIADAGYQVVE